MINKLRQHNLFQNVQQRYQSLHPLRWIVLTVLTVLTIVLLGCSRQNHSALLFSTPTNCRVVVHDLGESCIPLYPKRIVTIGILEELLALDIKPAGAAFWVAGGGSGSIPTYLKERVANMANLGNTSQPNLERLVQLKPDLIIGVPWGIEPIYQQLLQIAPTIVLDESEQGWKALLRRVANILDRTQQADHLLGSYEQRIAEFQQCMGTAASPIDSSPQTQVSVIRSFSSGLRIYMKDSFNGSILADVGLPRPPAQDKNAWFRDVSLESIADMDGDVIFVTHDDPQDSFLHQIVDHPLWRRLSAVRGEKVYTVDHEYWIGGSSIIAANLVLDDLFKYLTVSSEVKE